MAFSPLFREFFEKHFPNFSKKLNDSDEQQIKEIAEEVTQKTTYEEVLETLTRNQQLMRLFGARIAYMFFSRCSQCGSMKRFGKFSRSEIMMGFATLGLLGCLVAVVFLRTLLPQEAVSILSMIAGVFSACLRDVYVQHRKGQNDQIQPSVVEEFSSTDD